MSEFELNPMFLRMRRSLGDIVIYEREGQLYTRIKGKRGRTPSDAQRVVHGTFQRLTSDWSAVNGIMHTAWYASGEARRINGYNLFIKENFASERAGRPIELFRAVGDTDAPQILGAPAGSGEINISWTLPASGDRSLHLFVKKQTAGISDGVIRRISIASGAASPYLLSGLEPGSGYYVYAVLTDGEYAASQRVSASTGIVVTAGA